MKDLVKNNSSETLSSLRVAIVQSEYHGEITKNLAAGAKKLISKNVSNPVIDDFLVPGAYELPQVVDMLAKSKKYDAIIPLGCVIRGETAHFEFISQAIANGLDQAGRNSQIPVSFGVLTVDNLEQAKERAGGKWGNKGEEAAEAVLKLVKLRRDFERGKSKKSA